MKKLRLLLNWLLRKLRIIKDRSLENWVEKMLAETDKLFLLDLKSETPSYNLQQSLMKNAARYRLSKIEENEDESN